MIDMYISRLISNRDQFILNTILYEGFRETLYVGYSVINFLRGRSLLDGNVWEIFKFLLYICILLEVYTSIYTNVWEIFEGSNYYTL